MWSDDVETERQRIMKRPIGLRPPVASDGETFGLARAPESATHLPALDGLRALAVVMVRRVARRPPGARWTRWRRSSSCSAGS